MPILVCLHGCGLCARLDRSWAGRPHASDGRAGVEPLVDEVAREERPGAPLPRATVDSDPAAGGGSHDDGGDATVQLPWRWGREIRDGQVQFSQAMPREAGRIVRPLVEIDQQGHALTRQPR